MGVGDDGPSRGAVQVTTSTVTHNDNFELAIRPSVAPVPLAFVRSDVKDDYDDVKRYDAESVDRKHVGLGDDSDDDMRVAATYERNASDIDIESGPDHPKMVSFHPGHVPSPKSNERR